MGALCACLVPARAVGSVALPRRRPVTAATWLVIALTVIASTALIAGAILSAPKDKDVPR